MYNTDIKTVQDSLEIERKNKARMESIQSEFRKSPTPIEYLSDINKGIEEKNRIIRYLEICEKAQQKIPLSHNEIGYVFKFLYPNPEKILKDYNPNEEWYLVFIRNGDYLSKIINEEFSNCKDNIRLYGLNVIKSFLEKKLNYKIEFGEDNDLLPELQKINLSSEHQNIVNSIIEIARCARDFALQDKWNRPESENIRHFGVNAKIFHNNIVRCLKEYIGNLDINQLLDNLTIQHNNLRFKMAAHKAAPEALEIKREIIDKLSNIVQRRKNTPYLNTNF